MALAIVYAAIFIFCRTGVMAKRASVSTVIRIGSLAYYAHPLYDPYKSDQNLFDGDSIAKPCTVLTFNSKEPMSAEAIRSVFKDFETRDDVWSTDFVESVITQMSGSVRRLTDGEEDALHQIGVKDIRSLNTTPGSDELPQGPYFFHHGHLHQAYRLYPDFAGAFIAPTVPDDNGGYKPLDGTAYGEQYPSSLAVAVPSRLGFQRTTDKPYAGLRIAIKDIIDLKGLKTGGASRAYTELYSVKEETAETVQRLIDMGFVVVGKLKSTQFADSEWPTCDYVDYHAPFNPRGDGYLTPSGSSSGSASAVSTYSWLDFSLGTDTLGSIRSPSAAQAIFGMRPTHGAASTKGLIPYSSKWDTIGGFARTAAEYKVLAQALYGTQETKDKAYKKPTKLILPTDYWPVSDAASQKVFDTFVSKVERFLGVRRTEINIGDIWTSTRPHEADESLSKYMHHVFDWSANRDQWLGLLQPFVKEYIESRGKPPVLNPQVRFKVDYTPTVTEDEQNEAVKRLKTYHDWFYEYIMPTSNDGYSSSVMLLPWTTGEPDYRDKYKDGPQRFTGEGFFFYNVGPYASCPELIFPVGNTSYVSKFTGEEERLPTAVGFIGSEGSDIMLADFVSKIFEAEDNDFSDSSETVESALVEL